MSTLSAECQVCHKETPKTRIHYGGVSCYSCRAFFRRNTQRNDLPVCKSSGNCNIVFKERKQCASCRFNKCLRIGMRKELVLTEEDKKIRFKKLNEKKEKEQLEHFHHKSESFNESNSSPIQLFAHTDGKDNWHANPYPNEAKEKTPTSNNPFNEIHMKTNLFELYLQAGTERIYQQRKPHEIQTIFKHSRSNLITRERNTFCQEYEARVPSLTFSLNNSPTRNSFESIEKDEMESTFIEEELSSSNKDLADEGNTLQELLITEYVHKKFSRQQFACKTEKSEDTKNSEEVPFKRQSVIVAGPKLKHSRL